MQTHKRHEWILEYLTGFETIKFLTHIYQSGVERVAQSITNQVECQDCEHGCKLGRTGYKTKYGLWQVDNRYDKKRLLK